MREPGIVAATGKVTQSLQESPGLEEVYVGRLAPIPSGRGGPTPGDEKVVDNDLYTADTASAKFNVPCMS